MTQYTCPHCRGGFDDTENGACPWCGTQMDGEYDPDPFVRSYKKRDDDDESDSLFGTLFS